MDTLKKNRATAVNHRLTFIKCKTGYSNAFRAGLEKSQGFFWKNNPHGFY